MTAPPPAGSDGRPADGVIALLDDDVINCIAAGEVIERPASIVKELLENSFDAGARLVQVSLEHGGLARIAVSDDGGGMGKADVPRALLYHATSKLRRAEDLFAIRTLGFRGEALASIAAVSRLTLTSRRPQDGVATRLTAAGGRVESVVAVGAPVGTTVEVADLFFNTPARRAFMRSVATEQAHAVEAALRVCLGSGRGGVIVVAGGRRLLDLSERATAFERGYAALGPKVPALFSVGRADHAASVSLLAAPPAASRADSRGLYFFVNGRYVRERMLQRALLEGYRAVLAPGRSPFAIVHLQLPPADVDVNVHPQKLEVRFREPERIYRLVEGAVSELLTAAPWQHAASSRRLAITDRVSALSARVALSDARARFNRGGPMLPAPPGGGPRAAPQATLRGGGGEDGREAPAGNQKGENSIALGRFARLVPLGLAFENVIVCAAADALVLVDRDAALHRLAYERLAAARAAGEIARTSLVLPAIVSTSGPQTALVAASAAVLATVGFELEAIGPDRFALRAVPEDLGGADAAELGRELIAELAVLQAAGVDLLGAAATARLLGRAALGAVRQRGGAWSPAGLPALLAALDGVDLQRQVPHGRPVVRILSAREVAALFGA
ncbi:MAG: DNA mismatch repair endonuclease MutL [Deltaproteobacteria bacterium]|nr:DNA mismatch repair endonuclease MutL [Deltaproteobacteria bacterium]